jgi:hypothetical protein
LDYHLANLVINYNSRANLGENNEPDDRLD